MQIPRWQNVLFLKNSLKISTLLSSTTPATTTAATSIHFVASFHSTPTSCEKWKNKWNADAKRAQQPSKTYIRYQTRHKRADAKRALKDLLFRSGSSKFSFQDSTFQYLGTDMWFLCTSAQDEDPIWKFDGNCGGDIGSDRKGRSKSSAQHIGKPDLKRKKRKFRRESSSEGFKSFAEDYDDPKTIFQERFGNRWYTRTYQKREESSFQYSASGFEWREHSNRTDHGTKDWENESDVESDDEPCTVGSSSDRTILGLPPSGPLKLDDVKNAFRLSALKWHPDKHQGSSQAMAEEKFKLCLNAYKSLCAALS